MVATSVADEATIAHIVRKEAGGVTASLIRRFRDFDVAEESVQEALLVALERWPNEGVPSRPGGWLMTVATRIALNRLNREKRYQEKLREIAIEPRRDHDDDRLRLILTCCHPALSREAQVGLTLRAVCGFTTAQIARAFVASETTVAQRLVRAKRRIAAAGIPFRIPSESELEDRLGEVLAVLYLLFNEALLSSESRAPYQRDLAEDAVWLTELVHRLLPREPEVMGLLALMKLHIARGPARFDATGEMVLLADQDRSHWDRQMIVGAIRMIEKAGAMHRPGPYQLEAAIAACHAEAPTFQQTDWKQIIVLYDMIMTMAPSPVVRMNRAIALARVEGARLAVEELDGIAGELGGYHLFHAARGELLDQLGRQDEARAERQRALELTTNPAEVALLNKRLFA